MIGRGIDAKYTESGNNLILNYFADKYNQGTETYIKGKELGRGGNGVVTKITDTKDNQEYILKQSIYEWNESSKEGRKSEKLIGILDDDMIPKYQGTAETDFLISKYNGKDLNNNFKDKQDQIKNNYASITIQLLELLNKINSSNKFHNDIKVENVTIKSDKIYLIDFGHVSESTSTLGSLMTVSYKGLIYFLQESNFLKYTNSYEQLKALLKDTDIVGFFYCCIDLLLLIKSKWIKSYTILEQLGIINYDPMSFYKLFELFYFILPQSYRDKIKKIEELDNSLNYYNIKFPSIEETKKIFGDVPNDHINLFRFMAYIYSYIISNREEDIWYINFLKIMSDCFLPTFNYEEFIPKFKNIVLQFSNLPPPPPPPPLVHCPTSGSISSYIEQIAEWKRSVQETLTVVFDSYALSLTHNDVIKTVKLEEDILLIFNGLDTLGRMLFSAPDSKKAELLVNRHQFIPKFTFVYAWRRLQLVQEMLTVDVNGDALSHNDIIKTVDTEEHISLIYSGLDPGGRMLFSVPDSKKAMLLVRRHQFVIPRTKFTFVYAYPR